MATFRILALEQRLHHGRGGAYDKGAGHFRLHTGACQTPK